MHFERLEVQNFASYYGDHSLDLGCHQDKPVTVVIGGNGYGKSSLFDALNWALYGDDYARQLPQKRSREIVDYVNERAVREAATDSREVEMSATLYFEHNGMHYYTTQTLITRPTRSASGEIVAARADHMSALYAITHGGNHKRLEFNSATSILDEILPSNVRDYFLFDGDRIHQLSNPGSSQEVRDAIYRVVDLELISNAIQHLSQVATEHRRQAQRDSTDALKGVEDKYSEARERESNLKQDLDGQRIEEQAIRSQIETLEAKLENLPDTSELQTRRSERAARIRMVEEQIELTTIEMRRLSGIAALNLAMEPMKNAINELESSRKKGLIPRKVSQTLLKDLLKMHTCICGTDFRDGDSVYQGLMTRLRTEQERSSGEELIELQVQLDSALDQIRNATYQLEEKDKELSQSEEIRRALDIAIKEIDDELEKLPKENVAALTGELKQRRNALITVNRKQQYLEDRIAQCKVDINDLEKRRKELAAQQEKVKRSQDRERLAQRGADTLEEMYGDFAEESRSGVEKLTKDEFSLFMQSAGGYQVELSSDYELQVLDSNGNRALQRLSMGQSQCLSLSFITAISRVSEKNPPVVIDMPFSRLDIEVHDEVSRRLPEITSQLILFLLPGTEWNEITSENLGIKASHLYRLYFDKQLGETTIESLE